MLKENFAIPLENSLKWDYLCIRFERKGHFFDSFTLILNELHKF